MAWLILFFAGLLEVAWAVGLKYTEGFTKHVTASIGTGIAMAVSMLMLGYAMKFLPVGTAYAVWTGIGTLGTVALGIIWFGEDLTVPRLLCIGCIIAGILGLKFIEKA